MDPKAILLQVVARVVEGLLSAEAPIVILEGVFAVSGEALLSVHPPSNLKDRLDEMAKRAADMAADAMLEAKFPEPTP